LGVDLDGPELTDLAAAVVVQDLGDEPLARARRADHQHRLVAAYGPVDLALHTPRRRRVTEDAGARHTQALFGL
jgi:hypothetical protein